MTVIESEWSTEGGIREHHHPMNVTVEDLQQLLFYSILRWFFFFVFFFVNSLLSGVFFFSLPPDYKREQGRRWDGGMDGIPSWVSTR